MPRGVQLFSALVFLGLGLVVWWAMSQAAEKRLNPNKRDWESFVARQVAEQTTKHSYPLRRTLDFSPFEAALERLEAPMLKRLQTLTQKATIAELQVEMQSGRLTSEQLTLFYLWRIRRYNDALRAYLELNPAALEEARARDQERRRGQGRGVVHGMPLSLEENISTGGPRQPNAGSAVLGQDVGDRDGLIEHRWRAAGGVSVSKE